MRTLLLLFASGAAALVYQTLWVKQLGAVVGVDVYAVATTTAAFFAGLAGGAAVFGRRADRSARPLVLYGWLEVGVAVLGAAATLALPHTAALFHRLHEATGPVAWALPFALVALPAFLMGGTLPALVRGLAPGEGRVGQASGAAYAANTAGAVIGALATPFVLVPQLGIRGAGLAAAACNLALAALAFALGRRGVVAPAEAAPAGRLPGEARLAVALYAVAGGLALGYEVTWTQAIVPFLSTRTFAFAVVLATYLTGLVLGSALAARGEGRGATGGDQDGDLARRDWTLFGLLVSGAGLTALGSLAGLGPWLSGWQRGADALVLELTGSELAGMCARFVVAAAVVVLPTTVLLGAAFPVLVRLVARASRVGRDLGSVVALNTAGGIAGTLLTGFVVLPALGLVHTLGVLATGGAVVGAVALSRAGRRRLAVALVLVVAAVAVGVPRDKLGQLLAAERGGELVFHEESAAGAVTVLEQRAAGGGFRRLYIQGVSNSGDTLPSLRYMRLQALVPLIVHRGEPRSALVIGLGTGITTGALLAWPDLDRRVCAELLPAVVRAVDHFEGNLDVGDDPRVEIRVTDGRRELLAGGEPYDVITLEPPPPSAAGVVNLYSSEFYALCRGRLGPGGILAQWWPLATQNEEDSRSLVRSVLDVFPHVQLWSTDLHEALLVASDEPLELDVPRITTRFEAPTVKAALTEVGVESTTALLATYITDRAGLEAFVDGAPPVTDDRPLIEHAPWVREGELLRVLERLAELRSAPPLTASDDPFLPDEVETARHRLWTLYRAGYYAYMGQADRWESTLTRLGPELFENPYYRWFVREE